MGLSLLSFKAERWRGRTTLSVNDRGERRMVAIRNGIVTSDGSEIRQFPGWRCLLDFSPENNPNGFDRYIFDAVLPVYSPDGGIVAVETYYQRVYREPPDYPPTPARTLKCRAKPAHFHFIEQVDDAIIIGGETRFRECPLPDTPGDPWLTVERAGMIVNGTDQLLILTFSGPVSGYGVTSQHNYNGVEPNDVCFIDGLIASGNGSSGTAASVVQAFLDANVNGRVHKVFQVVGNTIRFYGDRFELSLLEDWPVSAGECHRVRPNYIDDYGDTPQGITPYDGNEFGRIDDPDALTSWRVNAELPFSISNSCSHRVYPAYVANRTRDFSDDNARYVEGIQPSALEGSQSGISRREQRRLPYRMVPEPAGNRIIIAVPGYHCLFQIPLMQPSNPNNWPATPNVDGLGIPWFENDVYDCPRALGVPKCRLIDSLWTPAPASPDESLEPGFNFLVECTSIPYGSTLAYTWPEGTYRMRVAYYDEVTGEEGPPSEIIDITVPAAETPDHAFAVRLAYFHPGYVMPECLAYKLRIYLTDNGGEVFGLYKTIGLTSNFPFARFGMTGDESFASAKYGFWSGATPAQIDSPHRSGSEWRVTYLPIPFASPIDEIGSRIDFTKPPLESNSMPRGASSARYIRGVLVSVGHAGVEPASVRLWPGRASMVFNALSNIAHDRENEILIRIHDGDLINPADGDTLAGFGIASRYFPDAYQGIFVVGPRFTFASKDQRIQVDKVDNRRVFLIDSPEVGNSAAANWERLALTESVFDSDLRYTDGIFMAEPDILGGRKYNQQLFYEMFKGQIQVGDQGNPWRVSKAGGRGIQFMDPNKDDDGVAVFQFAGNAVICTRKETFFYSWHRDAAGEVPTTINTDYGCIGPNSGTEFDGGICWLSERGPVALGNSLQFVGLDIEGDFVGDSRRYLTDSRGMMRHAIACHDGPRGQVYFGLITTDATHTMLVEMDQVSVLEVDDENLSRAPCNEILCWSYRTGSFTTWQPPAGLEVLWMRPIRMATDSTGTSFEVRIAMMCADGRVRVLDDQWQDDNAEALKTTAAASAKDSTALVLDGNSWGIDGNGGAAARQDGTGQNILVRIGQRVEKLDSDGNIVWDTTVASADPDTNTVTLAAAQTWIKGDSIRIGVRQPLEIETTFVGSETAQTIDTEAVQVRYTLFGKGKANVDTTVLKSDLDTGTVAKAVEIRHRSLGEAVGGDVHARRRQLHGKASGPEMAVKLVIASEPQVRVADIALEV